MKAKWFVCVAVLVVSTGMAYGKTPSFQGLGDLPGGSFYRYACAVSADGLTAVGRSTSGLGHEPFYWKEQAGMAGLGAIPNKTSYAFGTSADGSVVVGRIGDGAFRWTEQTGMVSLGYGAAWGVSRDGSVAVGHVDGVSGREAFLWTESGGMTTLGLGIANDVSTDGDVVVGTSGNEAFRWTNVTGMVGLGHLPGGGVNSKAFDVSADGSVVIGFSDSTSGLEVFRWTQSTGMVSLAEGVWGKAYGTSADGSVVVGRADLGTGVEAFVCDDTNGMRSLRSLLVDDYGLDLTSWILYDAQSISDDGLTIVGYGYNPLGDTEAWIAVIPEPATLSLLVLGGLALIRRRKSRA